MTDPILITGCARSGTSMTAGIIHCCGAFGGNMFGPNRNNRKGMFENQVIRQDIVKPYLRRMGVDPLGQRPLPSNRQIFETNKVQAEAWRTRIRETMINEGYKNGPWFYKGAKICLVWLIWHLAFPEAQHVIVRRKAEDIADSCMRTSFMRAYSDKKGWLKWVAKHEKRFDEMKQAGLNVTEFWPSKVIAGDFDYAREFVEGLGLKYNDALVKAFVDPTLYRRSDG
jgi:hypothetical protein